MANKDFHKNYIRFIKDVKKELTCSSNLKLAFVKDFKKQINDFLGGSQDITINDIITHFGNPKEIADSFESHGDLQRLNKIAKRYKSLKVGIITLSIIFIIILVIVLIIISNLTGDITIRN